MTAQPELPHNTQAQPPSPFPAERGEFTQEPEFKGPVKKRSCTDVICLFLFTSFLAGWVVIAFFAFRHGNPSILTYPTDSEGNICGLDQFKSRKFLFFFDILACAKTSVVVNGCPTPQVCVSSCPNKTLMLSPSRPDLESYKADLICKYNADMTLSAKELIETGVCASTYLKSKPLVGRCIPQDFLKTKDGTVIDDGTNKPAETGSGEKITQKMLEEASRVLAEFYNLQEFGQKIFSDLQRTWKIILVMLAVAMVIAFIWIVLMRFIAGIMVWISILAGIAVTGYACYYSVTQYMELKNKPQKDVHLAFSLNLGAALSNKSTWLALAIITGVLLIIMLLVLIFLRGRIFIAIALIKEASKAIGAMPPTLFFPIIPYLLQLLACAFWIALTLYIASSVRSNFTIMDALPGSIFKNGTTCDPAVFNATDAHCMFKNYNGTNSLNAVQAYNFFGFLWMMFFLIGLGQVALANAFASYYWTLNKSSDVKICAIVVGFYYTIRYHLGSVAFGSLLLATMRLIRIILEYIDRKCKKFDNAVTRAIMCCMRCFFFCLENFLKFISRNAYIMIAVYGENFCASARRAFDLLLRNVVRVFVLDQVTGFLLFIGKITIVVGMTVLSFYTFSGKIFKGQVPDVNYYQFPIIIVAFGTYVIVHVFFSVYGLAVDTLFLCFLEDLERNDGSPQKPYYMSKELMKILNKSNKYRDPLDKK